MNKEGRARLLVAKKIIRAELEIERNKFLNLPESLQESSTIGDQLSTTMQELEAAIEALNEVGV